MFRDRQWLQEEVARNDGGEKSGFSRGGKRRQNMTITAESY